MIKHYESVVHTFDSDFALEASLIISVFVVLILITVFITVKNA